MNEFDFSILQPYIDDEYITDINYNGKHLWLDHLKKGRYSIQDFNYHHECMQLGYRFANYANLTFNAVSPIVEAETGDLRISLVHGSVCDEISISIRKTPAIMRLTQRVLKKQNYAPVWLLQMLAEFVKIKSNIIVSGLPGAGKTELVKYLSQFIEPHQRVITIEDTYELRYRELHPKSDCIALKVNDRFSYHDAIKACLRQRPDWMLVSEVRGNEVVNLLQSVSTGATLLSTIHAPSAHHIPRRLLHMFPGVEMSNDILHQMIFDIIDVGVHVEASISKKGVKRYIKEVVAYEVVDNMPVKHVLYQYDETDPSSVEWSTKLNEKKKLYESTVKHS
jgi:pilus assembly protein CpaF